MEKESKLVVVMGPSAVGKDTVARMLEKEHGYNFTISTTSRPIRDGESEKDPYYFVTREKFEELIRNNEMIEYRTYNTLANNIPDVWYYGVEKRSIDPEKDYVMVLDMVGLKAFKEQFPEKVISFYIYVDENIRKERCLARGDFDESEWNRRLADDKIVFDLAKVVSEGAFVIDGNQKPETVLRDVNRLIGFHDIKWD